MWFALCVCASADPLSCFVEEKTPSNTICQGAYSIKHNNIKSASDCAGSCLSDKDCKQFVMHTSGSGCRISHSCVQPTSASSDWDGYLRKNTSDCQGGTPAPVPGPPTPPPTPPAPASGLHFYSPLFADGMILQRDMPTKIWGGGAAPGAKVQVVVADEAFANPIVATTSASNDGNWTATLPGVAAKTTSILQATDGKTTATLNDVAFGDVILCGGQSNMGFGMCGSRSKNQTVQQALDALNPGVRFYFQSGSGPNGGAGTSHCSTLSGVKSVTPEFSWFKANASNSGGASAVCMLTAQYLHASMNRSVPVGAVESCVGGTNVEPWTPPDGDLYQAHIVPLLPMTFKLALWDQGEADAKRTNSTWYTHEFPAMIRGWRSVFEVPELPFFYVELCTEYGAQEPKEDDFWMAQRSCLALPKTGFATTTDIERALHPPDKQDVAARLLLEVQRVAYGVDVISRGPELVSVTSSRRHQAPAPGSNGKDGIGDTVTLTLTFSNATLTTHEGVYVGAPGACTTAVEQRGVDNKRSTVPFKINGDQVVVTCTPSPSAGFNHTILVNSDTATCFLYGPNGLPAPPIEVACA